MKSEKPFLFKFNARILKITNIALYYQEANE
jgi:hypothetical protein